MAAGMATRIRPATPDSCLLVHTPATAEAKNRLHSSCPALACYLRRTSSHNMPLNSSGAASNRSCTGSRKLCRSRQQQQRPDPDQNACMLRDHPHQGKKGYEPATAVTAAATAGVGCVWVHALSSHTVALYCCLGSPHLAECHHRVGDECNAQPQSCHERITPHELCGLHQEERMWQHCAAKFRLKACSI